MKKIADFVQKTNEGFNWTSTSSTGDEVDYSYGGLRTSNGDGISPDYVNLNGRRVKMDPEDVERKVKGKNADSNITRGRWGLDEPEDDDALNFTNPEDYNDNVEDLMAKFDAEEDFFIEGAAGWGKTSVIKKMAKKFGRSIITVYLDKIMASDLGGIPIPTKAGDVAVQEMAMPAWAATILTNPDKQFLLFFDEMNQAAPDVMNALMPIVLEHEICGIKFENFFVGAAGNFVEENRGGVSKLSGPLESRFKPIIHWRSGTEETWKSAFAHLRKKWADKIGDAIIDKYEEYKGLFANPREIDHKVFAFAYNILKKGAGDKYGARLYLERLKDLASKDITRTEKDQKLKELAEYTAEYIKNGGQEPEDVGRKTDKTMEMIPENYLNTIIRAVKLGYLTVDGVKYGVSEENFADCIDPELANGEIIERMKKKFAADGIKFKYKKVSQFKKDGIQEYKE